MKPESVVVDLSQRIVETSWEQVRAQAADPQTSATELSALAGHLSFIVRAAVAAHPNTPADVRAQLAVDPHPAVRRAVTLTVQ